MTGAEHLIAYAESWRPAYDRLCDLERRQRPGAPDCFLTSVGCFHAASNLIQETYREAVKCHDMFPADISATDIAEAVCKALESILPWAEGAGLNMDDARRAIALARP